MIVIYLLQYPKLAVTALAQLTENKRQHAQPLQVVNISEGWGPPRKLQHAQPLQVVNLSEGCSPGRGPGCYGRMNVWVAGVILASGLLESVIAKTAILLLSGRVTCLEPGAISRLTSYI